MRFSLTSLVRLISFVAIGLSAVAVGLSRAVPPVPTHRTPAAPRQYGLNGNSFTPPQRQNFVLDGTSGELRPDRAASSDSPDFVTSSPWTDQNGGHELLGRLTVREGSLATGTVLARFAEGETEPRSSVAVRPVISGRPCWLPSRPSRVLFPSGDGRLYVTDLRPGDGLATDAPADVVAEGAESPCRRVVWGCPAPGTGPPILGDPICPPVAALKGRLIVSLCAGWQQGAKGGFGASELWWLQVGPDDATITAAGRLTVPDTGRPDVPLSETRGLRDDERLANVAALPDGRVVIAYLSRPPGRPEWALKVAPVQVDGSGVPSVRVSDSAVVGDDVAVTLPPLSPDGRSVYRVRRLVPGRVPVVERVAIDGPVEPFGTGPVLTLAPPGIGRNSRGARR